jgi:uncharacterized protein (TIGR02246 family)
MTDIRAFIDKINQAWAEGDADYLLANVTDDVRFTMVGGEAAEGKDAFAKTFAANADAPTPRITFTSVITCEAAAIVEGTMVMPDASGEVKHYAFCDVYRLRRTEDGKIEALTAYILETNKQP